jgi:carbamoyl-phosphate synthase large subunit
MIDKNKCILVTGIGGNVGQGIIRIIRKEFPEIKIVGTNVTGFSPGNHLVDKFYFVPFGYETNFIEVVENIVLKENVNLIVPSTDYETFFLTKSKSSITCLIASSHLDATKIYLDKYLSYKFHYKNNIPFAETVLPSEFSNQFDKAIAKPREGRGSKGIFKNIVSNEGFKDEVYIIQRFYEGIEITTGVYVSYITGELCGMITFERSLENGATTYCKVIYDYNDALLSTIQKILTKLEIRGSFNIQSIVTESGEVVPFEVNCRISGTNSIRHHFGFCDVKNTVDELIFGKCAQQMNPTSGFAYRMLTDIIYNTDDVKGNKEDNFIKF